MGMFSGQDVVTKARRRKKQKRLPFAVKIAFVIEMMTKNAEALTLIREMSGWGFTMSQIADMTTYERSTALMADLLKASDAGLLEIDIRPNPSNGLSPVTYYFYTPDEYTRALKQNRLFI